MHQIEMCNFVQIYKCANDLWIEYYKLQSIVMRKNYDKLDDFSHSFNHCHPIFHFIWIFKMFINLFSFAASFRLHKIMNESPGYGIHFTINVQTYSECNHSLKITTFNKWLPIWLISSNCRFLLMIHSKWESINGHCNYD